MSNIYTSVSQLIGRTPLLEVTNIAKADNLKARLLVKLEGCNPAGSAKDRVGLSMIEDAEKSGLLKPGGLIIEPQYEDTAARTISRETGAPVFVLDPIVTGPEGDAPLDWYETVMRENVQVLLEALSH